MSVFPIESPKSTPTGRPPVIWVDLDDLLAYVTSFRQPSGIQRVLIEVGRALHEDDPEGHFVRFCRHDQLRDSFIPVSWESVEAAIEFKSVPSSSALPQFGRERGPFRSALRSILARLPHDIREPIGRLLRAFVQATSALFDLVVAGFRGVARLARNLVDTAPRPGPPQSVSSPVSGNITAGDILLAIGAAWIDPNFEKRLSRLRRKLGLQYAVIVYDLIPLVRPEWVHPAASQEFRMWWETAVPQADFLFAISKATARDVESKALKDGITLRGPVVPIPMGSGFGNTLKSATGTLPTALSPGDYALFVSTIDVRKNHLTMFRVWRRLLETRLPNEVPKLVFVGRVGWLVADLLQQIANTVNLEGHLILLPDVSDAELATLYAGCRFTLFPSLYEGWGLPVTESLAFGKPCIASDRTSVPEAGGNLARYVDPENVLAWVAEIGFWLDHPDALAEWEARIRREFRPVPWSETASALRRAIGIDAADVNDPAPVAAPATP